MSQVTEPSATEPDSEGQGPTPTKVVKLAEVEMPERMEISPGASAEEMAAILVAYDELWPEPISQERVEVSDWRFAGRWWRGIGPGAPMAPNIG